MISSVVDKFFYHRNQTKSYKKYIVVRHCRHSLTMVPWWPQARNRSTQLVASTTHPSFSASTYLFDILVNDNTKYLNSVCTKSVGRDTQLIQDVINARSHSKHAQRTDAVDQVCRTFFSRKPGQNTWLLHCSRDRRRESSKAETSLEGNLRISTSMPSYLSSFAGKQRTAVGKLPGPSTIMPSIVKLYTTAQSIIFRSSRP